MVAFVFIHSPLVGPFTWSLVAAELRRLGVAVVLPNLHEQRDPQALYWKQHATAVARAVATTASDHALILVAHSGAGPMLPAVRQMIERPIAAYLFVDAGLLENGKSRFDLFDHREAAQQFRAAASNGLLPTWSDDDLREVIPNDDMRRRFVAELQPTPLAVYEEPLPVFAGWPDAPCGYLQFSSVYDRPAEQARRMGWAFRKIEAGHFHMLVAPQAVTDAMLDLVAALKLVDLNLKS